MKKILCVLSIVSALTVLSTNTVFCDDTLYTDNHLQYTVNGNSISIVYYYGEEEELTIPRTFGLYDVTTIEKGAFKDSKVKVLNIPNTITNIYDNSLDNMKVNILDIYGNIVEKEINIIKTAEPIEKDIKEEPSSNSYELSNEQKTSDIEKIPNESIKDEINNGDNKDAIELITEKKELPETIVESTIDKQLDNNHVSKTHIHLISISFVCIISIIIVLRLKKKNK